MSLKTPNILFFEAPIDSKVEDSYTFEQTVSEAIDYPYALSIRYNASCERIHLVMNHEEIARLITWLKDMEPTVNEKELA